MTSKDRNSFKLAEPFKTGYRSGTLPMLIAENSLGFTAQVEIQKCDLDADQARALRDWLTSVLPDETPAPLPLGFVLVAQCASCQVKDAPRAQHSWKCAALPGQFVRIQDTAKTP